MENLENVGGKRAQDLHCANYMRAKRYLLPHTDSTPEFTTQFRIFYSVF